MSVWVLLWVVVVGGGVTSGVAYLSTEAACRTGKTAIEAAPGVAIASCIRDEMPAGDF